MILHKSPSTANFVSFPAFFFEKTLGGVFSHFPPFSISRFWPLMKSFFSGDHLSSAIPRVTDPFFFFLLLSPFFFQGVLFLGFFASFVRHNSVKTHLPSRWFGPLPLGPLFFASFRGASRFFQPLLHHALTPKGPDCDPFFSRKSILKRPFSRFFLFLLPLSPVNPFDALFCRCQAFFLMAPSLSPPDSHPPPDGLLSPRPTYHGMPRFSFACEPSFVLIAHRL